MQFKLIWNNIQYTVTQFEPNQELVYFAYINASFYCRKNCDFYWTDTQK